MTELEIMQHAKDYLDKLAKGIDPLTGRDARRLFEEKFTEAQFRESLAQALWPLLPAPSICSRARKLSRYSWFSVPAPPTKTSKRSLKPFLCGATTTQTIN